MKRRTRIWVEYGTKYYARDTQPTFEIRQIKSNPPRMLVIIYKEDEQVRVVLECDLSLHYLNYLDKYYGIFIQIPREAA